MKKIIFTIFYICFLFLASCNNKNNGGYQFVEPKDSFDLMNFNLPLKKIMSKREVLMNEGITYWYEYCYEIENISLQPKKENLFRFVYMNGFGNVDVILLQKNTIKVTSWQENRKYERDTTKNPEYKNRALLRTLIDYHSTDADSSKQQIVEKLKKMGYDQPEAVSNTFYETIKKKAQSYYIKGIKVLDTLIHLDSEKYDNLVNKINNSGYWKLKPYDQYCGPMADGHFYFLEANAYGKYNYVSTDGCDDFTKFKMACQELVNNTPLKERMTLFIEK